MFHTYEMGLYILLYYTKYFLLSFVFDDESNSIENNLFTEAANFTCPFR